MKKITKRIVSFITALSLSISSTVMVLPASAFQLENMVEVTTDEYDAFNINTGSIGNDGDGKTDDDNTNNKIVTEGDGNDDDDNYYVDVNGDIGKVTDVTVTDDNDSVNKISEPDDEGEEGTGSSNITVSTCDYGIINCTTSTAAWGDTVTFTLTPDAHYAYKEGTISITGSEGSVTYNTNDDGSFSFTMPNYDVTISAEFEQVDFKVTLSAGENCTLYYTSGVQEDAYYEKGTKVTVSAVAITKGYVVTKVKVNGSTEGVTNSGSVDYSFTMPAEDVTVTAEVALSIFSANGKGFASWNSFCEYVAAQTEKKDYIISPYGDLTLTDDDGSDKFSFPENASSIWFANAQGKNYSLTFNVNNVSIPCDMTFNVEVKASQSVSVEISVAENAKVTFNGAGLNSDGDPYITSITGETGSVLDTGDNTFAVGSIKSFMTVKGTGIDVYNNTDITSFEGVMSVKSNENTVAIKNVVDGSVFTLYKNDNGDLPTLSVEDVLATTTTASGATPTFTIMFRDSDYNCASVDKTTIICNIGEKDITDNIIIDNGDGAKLYPFLDNDNNAVRGYAESEFPLTLKWGENDDDGSKSKSFASLDKIVKYINEQTTKADYTITLNENLTVPASFDFGDITNANSLTFEGSGKYINFAGTKVTIPFNMTFNVEIRAATTVDITVADNVTATFNGGSVSQKINSIKGGNNSILNIAYQMFYVNDISSFKSIKVDSVLSVLGEVSNVAKFEGGLHLATTAEVSLGDVVDGSNLEFIYYNGFGKLTVSDVIASATTKGTPKINVDFLDGGGYYTVTSGTTILYTDGKDLSGNITVGGDYGDALNPHYYSFDNSIRVYDNTSVNLSALTLKSGDETIGSYPDLSVIAEYINSQSTAKDYTIVLNENLTVPASFDFDQITQAKSITFEGSGKTITFAGTELNIPYNVTFNPEFKANTTVDITVANNVTVAFNGAGYNYSLPSSPYIKSITGGTGSVLNTGKSTFEVNDISKFQSVTGSNINVYGNVSNVAKFEGGLHLATTAEVSLSDVVDGSEFVFDYDQGFGKLTVSDVIASDSTTAGTTPKIEIIFLGNGSYYTVASKTTILYTNGKDLSENISIYNDENGTVRYPVYCASEKAIKALAESDLPLTLKCGNESKSFASLNKIVKYINEQTTKADYTIFLNENLTVPASFKFEDITKANSITFDDSGKTITFEAATLNIPYNVTFNTAVEASNRVSITVADNVTVTFNDANLIDASKPYITTISGGTGSVLVANGRFHASEISNFQSVTGSNIKVNNKVSNVDNFNGVIYIMRGYYENSISNVENGSSIYLCEDGGKLPKLTVSDVIYSGTSRVDTPKFNINFVDYMGNSCSVDSGTTVLYTNGKDLSANIDIDNGEGTALTSYYFKSDKSIRGYDANDLPLTLKKGEDEVGDFPNLEFVTEYINKQTDKDDYTIVLNKDLTVPASFDFDQITKANSINFDGSGKTIKFEGTELNIPYDVTFNPEFKANTTVDITVADNVKVTFNGAYPNSNNVPYINSITGGNNSVLITGGHTFAVNNISNFQSVTGAAIHFYGKVSNVANFNGWMKLMSESSEVSIGNVEDGSMIDLYADGEKLSKLTVSDVINSDSSSTGATTPKLAISFIDSDGQYCSVDSGTTVLYTNGKDLSANIDIENDKGTALTSYYFKSDKSIRGYDANDLPLTLKKGEDEVGDFPNLEFVTEYINKQTDKDDYIIFLNKDLTLPASFKFEDITKANSIAFDNLEKVITFEGTTLNIPYNVQFNLAFMASTSVDITVADNVTVTFADSGSTETRYINSIKGGTGSVLNTNGSLYVNNISDFQSVTGVFAVYGNVSNVANFEGAMFIMSESSEVSIGNVEDGSTIKLYYNSGELSKLTVSDVVSTDSSSATTPKFTLSFLTGSSESTSVKKGTTILYTNGKDLSGNITINNDKGTALTPYYFKSDKSIRGYDAYDLPLTLEKIGGTINFPSLEHIADYINKQTDKADYTICLNENLTVPASFKFDDITQAKSITFDNLEKVITFEGTTLNIPYNVQFNLAFMASTSVDITVADNVTVTFADSGSTETRYINSIKGGTGSVLNTNGSLYVNNISDFQSVTGVFAVYGNVSNVANFDGKMNLMSESSEVSIGNVEYGSSIRLYAKGEKLPKLTVSDVVYTGSSTVENLMFSIVFIDLEGNYISVENGTTVCYTNGKDLSGNITINNAKGTVLTAFYYSKDKSIRAEDASLITIKSDDVEKSVPNFEKLAEFISEADADDYTITINDSITVPADFDFNSLSKADSIKFKSSSDYSLTFAGKNVNIPCDMNFDVKIKAGDEDKELNFNVAAGKKLTINGIGNPHITKISGGEGSQLDLGTSYVYVNEISGFSSLTGKNIWVYKKVSDVKSFSGKLYLDGDAFVDAVIGNVADGSKFYLIEDENGKLPKLTISDITYDEAATDPRITIAVLDNTDFNKVAVQTGTTVCYTNGKDLSQYIAIDEENKTANGKPLTAFYYSSDNSIKAEFAEALILYRGEGGVYVKSADYPNIDKAFAAMTEYKNYKLVVNTDLVLPESIKLPEGISSLDIAGVDDNVKLIFTGDTLDVTTVLGLDISAEKTNGYLDVNIAKGIDLTIRESFKGHIFNVITGAENSGFSVNTDVEVSGISNIYNVDVIEGKKLNVKGYVSDVDCFSGDLVLRSVDGFAEIDNIYEKSNISLVQSGNKISKLTIGSISDDAELTVKVTADGENLVSALKTATTVLYTKTNKFADIDKVKIGNTNKDGKNYTAFYYSKTKEVKAEDEYAVILKAYDEEKGENVEVGHYTTIEKALAAMTEAKSYSLILNISMDAPANFNINKNIKSLEIVAEYATGANLTFTGTKLTIPKDVTLNIPVAVNNKTGLIDVSVSANATFTLGLYYWGDVINKLSGAKNAEFVDISGNAVAINQLSNFKNVIVGSNSLTVNGNITGIENLFTASDLIIAGEKTTANITNVDSAVITLVQKDNGTLPKLTITSVSNEGSLHIYVANNFNRTIPIQTGTTLFYTKTANFDASNVIVENRTANSKTLKPVFYSKTKCVKAEADGCFAVRIMVDGKTQDTFFSDFDAAIKSMTIKGADYYLYVYTAAPVPSNFTMPKDINSLYITNGTVDGGKLIFTGTKLNVTKTLRLDIPVEVSNKTGKIDVSVAKDQEFIVMSNFSGDVINKLSGTKTSVFTADTNITVGQLATFGLVSTPDADNRPVITVNGNVTAVEKLNGILTVSGAKSKAAVNTIDGTSTVNLVQSGTSFPALTIGSIISGDNFTVNIVDENGEKVGVKTGTAILNTTKPNAVDTEKIIIGNKTPNGNALKAFAYNKVIKAEVEEALTVTVRDYDSYESVTVGSYKDIDSALAVMTKETGDYTLTLNTDIVLPTSFKFPKNIEKINSLKINNGNGDAKLIFTGTKLEVKNILYLDLPVEANNKTGKIDVSVAKNCQFILYSGFKGDIINKLSGTKNSSFTNWADVTIGQISTLSIWSYFNTSELTVNGNITAVNKLYGKLTVSGAKSKAAIDNIFDDSVINLVQTGSSIPAVTIGSINDEKNLTVNIVDEDGKNVDIQSGTAILSAKNNKFADVAKITIGNTDSVGNTLKATFDGKKTIKAEYTEAINVKFGEETESFTNLADAVKFIEGKKASAEVTLTINSDITAATNFALPKKNVSKLTLTGDGSITFAGTKLAIPYDTIIDVDVLASNKAKAVDLTVAKNAKLTINESSIVYADEDEGTSYFGKITGNSGAALECITPKDYLYCNGITKFDKLTGDIVSYGSVTGIGEYAGRLDVYGTKSSIEIGKINNFLEDDDEEFTKLYLNENETGTLPKVTIKEIADNAKLRVQVYNYDGLSINLESGRTILYTKDNKFADADQILIENEYEYDDEDDKLTFKAVFDAKTKSVKAVCEKAVSLYEYDEDTNNQVLVKNESNGYFTTFAEAVSYINANGNANARYYIYVNASVTEAKFVLPNANKAKYITILCENGAEIDIGKAASITTNANTQLDDVKFKTTAKTLTINAKSDLAVYGDSNVDAFKGNAKSTLSICGNDDYSYDISGFYTAYVGSNSSLKVNSLKVKRLIIGYNAELVIGNSFKSGSFSNFVSYYGATIRFEGSPKGVLSYTGTADDFGVDDKIKITGDIGNGTKILTAKALTNVNELFTTDAYDESVGVAFVKSGNNICLKVAVLELYVDDKSVGVYSDWSDMIKAINRSNEPSNTDYTVKLLGDYRSEKELSFPTKGKYSWLGIDSEGEPKKLSFPGSLDLTAGASFNNVELYSYDKKTGEQADYSINASGYQLAVRNVNTSGVSINAYYLELESTGLYAESIDADVLYVDKRFTAKNITADDFAVDSYSPIQLYLVEGGKLNVSSGIALADDGNIELNFVDEDGDVLDEIPDNYELGTIHRGSDYITVPNGFKLEVSDTGKATIKHTQIWRLTDNTITFDAHGVNGGSWKLFENIEAKGTIYPLFNVLSGSGMVAIDISCNSKPTPYSYMGQSFDGNMAIDLGSSTAMNIGITVQQATDDFAFTLEWVN